jgi:hypothetical protein
MTLDPRRLVQVVNEEFGKLPHPDVPEITNADYPTYQRVAAMKRNPHPPTHHDVRDTYHEITQSGISASQWEHAWTISRPLANRMLGRDPTLQELVRHGDAHPTEIHDYYSNLPSRSHPDIKAGVMMKYLHMANDVANRHLERPPLLREVAKFAASEFHPVDIENHYLQMKQERNDAGGN